MKFIDDLMEGDMIDEILYLKNKIIATEVRKIKRSCEELGVTLRIRYREGDMSSLSCLKTTIADERFCTFINVPHNPFGIAIKRVLDINMSLIAIILFSPFLLFIAILVKASSKGPVLFKQERIGLRGRKFKLLKYRTMVANAEELRKELDDQSEVDGPVFKIADDPRITKIGKFLRKSGLDELPQLFNILKGKMSLIGPRPPLESEVVQYKRWQLRRISVRPGLTCLWQISPNRNRIKFEQWMEMDLAYIDNWSLRLDFQILLRTITTVLLRTGL